MYWIMKTLKFERIQSCCLYLFFRNTDNRFIHGAQRFKRQQELVGKDKATCIKGLVCPLPPPPPLETKNPKVVSAQRADECAYCIGEACLKFHVCNCGDVVNALTSMLIQKGAFTNSVDPVETPHNAASHQDLCYLPCYAHPW